MKLKLLNLLNHALNRKSGYRQRRPHTHTHTGTEVSNSEAPGQFNVAHLGWRARVRRQARAYLCSSTCARAVCVEDPQICEILKFVQRPACLHGHHVIIALCTDYPAEVSQTNSSFFASSEDSGRCIYMGAASAAFQSFFFKSASGRLLVYCALYPLTNHSQPCGASNTITLSPILGRCLTILGRDLNE